MHGQLAVLSAAVGGEFDFEPIERRRWPKGSGRAKPVNKSYQFYAPPIVLRSKCGDARHERPAFGPPNSSNAH